MRAEDIGLNTGHRYEMAVFFITVESVSCAMFVEFTFVILLTKLHVMQTFYCQFCHNYNINNILIYVWSVLCSIISNTSMCFKGYHMSHFAIISYNFVEERFAGILLSERNKAKCFNTAGDVVTSQ